MSVTLDGTVFADVHVEQIPGGLLGRPTVTAGWLPRGSRAGADLVRAVPPAGRVVQVPLVLSTTDRVVALALADQLADVWDPARGVVTFGVSQIPGWEWCGVLGRLEFDPRLRPGGVIRALGEVTLLDPRRYQTPAWGTAGVAVTAGGSTTPVTVGQRGQPAVFTFSSTGVTSLTVEDASGRGLSLSGITGTGTVTVDGRRRQITRGGVDMSEWLEPGSVWPELPGGATSVYAQGNASFTLILTRWETAW